MALNFKKHALGALFLLGLAGCNVVEPVAPGDAGPSGDGAMADAPSDAVAPTDSERFDAPARYDGRGADAPREPEGGPPDASREDSASRDGGVAAPDAGANCERAEASVEAVLGVEGGSLALCGAQVSVAPGSLRAATVVRFARTTAVRAPVGPVVVDGYAYTLEAAGARPAVTLSLPHAADAHAVELYEHVDGAWTPLGLCDVREGVARQTFVGTGTFALLYDVRALPTSPRGLGTVAVEASVGGRSGTYEQGTGGYAVVSALPNGARAINFEATMASGRTLHVEVLTGPGEEQRPASVYHLDERGMLHEWSTNYEGLLPMDLTLTPLVGGLRGRLVGQLRDDAGATARLDARFDLAVVAWRPLPTRTCAP